MCSFLVSAQETNQRRRLGEALTAKSFVTVKTIRHLQPDFEPPSPRPPSGPVENLVMFDFVFDTQSRIYYAAAV